MPVLAFCLSGDKVFLLTTAAYTRVAGSQASEACPISVGMTDMLYPVWLSTGFEDLNTRPQAGIANIYPRHYFYSPICYLFEARSQSITSSGLELTM